MAPAGCCPSTVVSQAACSVSTLLLLLLIVSNAPSCLPPPAASLGAGERGAEGAGPAGAQLPKLPLAHALLNL